MADIPTARNAFDVTEIDPLTNEEVSLTVFQDEKTGRYFAVDSSWFIDEDVSVIKCPFGHTVELTDENEF